MTKATVRVIDGGAAGLAILGFSTALDVKGYLTTNEVSAVSGAVFRVKSTKNDGAWSADQVIGGFLVETADSSGGGAGDAGGFEIITQSGIGSSAITRLYASSTLARKVKAFDAIPDGLAPHTTAIGTIGTSALNWLTAFIRTVFFGPAAAQKLTSVAGSPEASVTAEIGSLVTDLTNGALWIKKTGTGNTGYILSTDIVDTATAASIAAVANAINTAGKRAGKVVWDSTNNRAMRASGALAASPWHVLDGSATVTPA